jgi:hypothetical protein
MERSGFVWTSPICAALSAVRRRLRDAFVRMQLLETIMRARLVVLIAAVLLSAPALVVAQQPTGAQPGQRRAIDTTGYTPNRDVILEVPELSVDSIGLTVQNVRAHVAVDLNAMNLVTVTAGVDVYIKQVQLSITGVFAEAYLYADLDNVARIVDRVVLTLDRNPDILTQVLKTVDTGVNALTGQQTPTRR